MTRQWIGSVLLVAALSAIALGGDTKEADRIDGAWGVAKAELAGKAWPEELRKITHLTIDGDKYAVLVGDLPDKGNLKFDPSASPKALDITGTEGPNKGKTYLAIYERDGDTLRICYDLSGKERPTEFKTAEGTNLFLVTYVREKKS